MARINPNAPITDILFNFNNIYPYNLASIKNLQSWSGSAGLNIVNGTIGITSGNNSLLLGTLDTFNYLIPANASFWGCCVFTYANYVNQGSSVNCIHCLGTIDAAQGPFIYMGSNNILVVNTGNAYLSSPSALVDGRLYYLVYGRDSIGNTWAWLNGSIMASGSGSIAGNRYRLTVLSDYGTNNRYFKGTMHLLAYGRANPVSFGRELSMNPWNLFMKSNYDYRVAENGYPLPPAVSTVKRRFFNIF